VDFLALGYEIDTDLEHGSGVGELTIGIKEQLFDIAEEALRQDFPEVDRDQVNLVIGRTIDLYTPGKYFIDVFIEAMEERKKIMNEYR
jgi:hypothetical protein